MCVLSLLGTWSLTVSECERGSRAWAAPAVGVAWSGLASWAAQGWSVSGEGVSLSASCSWFQGLPSGPEPSCVRLCTRVRDQIVWATGEEAGDSPSSFSANPRSQQELKDPACSLATTGLFQRLSAPQNEGPILDGRGVMTAGDHPPTGCPSSLVPQLSPPPQLVHPSPAPGPVMSPARRAESLFSLSCWRGRPTLHSTRKA